MLSCVCWFFVFVCYVLLCLASYVVGCRWFVCVSVRLVQFVVVCLLVDCRFRCLLVVDCCHYCCWLSVVCSLIVVSVVYCCLFVM